jgi:antagonist of SinR
VIEEKETMAGIDVEWLKLIIEAKKMGIEKGEIRDFFKNSGVKEMVLEG